MLPQPRWPWVNEGFFPIQLFLIINIDASFDNNDDLNSNMGTETLTANDLMSKEFQDLTATSSLPQRRIDGRSFVVVDQTANRRAGSKVSKI